MENLPKVIEIKGNWKLQRVSTGDSYPASVPGCVHLDLLASKVIEDPFYRTNEKKQQWIDKEDWVYLTDFEAANDFLNNEVVQLDFKGLDTYADVYLNDSLILKSDNMFREWIVDCKNYLKSGKNQLKIYFHSPINIGLQLLEKNGYALPAGNDQSENGGLGDKRVSPFTRKAPYHYGWDWGPRFVSSGIWRPVYLKSWSNAKIESVQIIQHKLTDSLANLMGNVTIKSNKVQIATIKIIDKNSKKELFSVIQELSEGENTVELPFTIKDPKRWWTNGLGEAYLYELETTISVEDKIIDKNIQQIGLRTIELIQEPDKYGQSFYFKLNGVPVFMKGANHIPNDIFLTRVSPEIYEREIKDAVESNMNMLRVWGGGIYEDDVFYDLCDKYGILVWQDFMFACSMYPGNDEFIANVGQEAKDNIIRLRNHPSIALWCGNNEIDVAWQEYGTGGWGWKELYNPEQHKEIWNSYEKIFHGVLPEMIENYDNGRFYWPSSPMAGPKQAASYTTTSGDMHYWGVWHGKERFSEFQNKKARFMSEYGFQSFPEFKTVQKYTIPEDYNIESEVMAAHQRSGIGNLRIKEYIDWYYRQPKDFENFLYVGQVLQAQGIKMAIEAHRRDMPYCMGTLFWQINDCWPVASWSSIDYYGNWKAVQYSVKKAFQEILLSPVIQNDTMKIFVISDKLSTVNSKLKLEVINFEGETLALNEIDLEIEANTSKNYFQIPVKQLLKNAAANNIVVSASLVFQDKILSSNLLYLVEAKDLKLVNPKIKSTLEKNDKGIKITLETDKLAKNIFLSFDGDQGHFSDNYFDLLPGKAIEIIYYPEHKDFDYKDKLKIITLIDSYE
jgi:beta-mannosidase